VEAEAVEAETVEAEAVEAEAVEAGIWKRKRWKRLNFCWSGSKLGSIWLFEEPEAKAFFIKHAAEMCGSIFVEAEAQW